MKRFLKHILMPKFIVRRYFSRADFSEIEAAIKGSEKLHSGEIVFAAEAHLEPLQALKNITAHQRALEVFSNLRVWDTEKNNGVLIYLLLAEKNIEIIADRGINAVVASSFWDEICSSVEKSFRAGEFKSGILSAVSVITSELQKHFPDSSDNKDELSNTTRIL